MKNQNKIFLNLLIILTSFNSCYRTELNKYIIKEVQFKTFSLSKTNEDYYKIDNMLINNQNKKYLILLFIKKSFVSDNSKKNGSPNEGMDGRIDSIIYCNFKLSSESEICINVNNTKLMKSDDIIICNLQNKYLLKSCSSDEICNLKEMSFDSFIKYYNKKNIDETYGSEQYFIPFIVNFDCYKKFIKNKNYINTVYNNKKKQILLHHLP